MERLFNATYVEIVVIVSQKVNLINHDIPMYIMVHVVRQTS